jgi:hypothetical protein
MDSTYLFKSFNLLKLNQLMLVPLMPSLFCLGQKTLFFKMINKNHFYSTNQNLYLETQITINPPFLEITVNQNNLYLADRVHCLLINLIFLLRKMIWISNRMDRKDPMMSIIKRKRMEQNLWWYCWVRLIKNKICIRKSLRRK